MNINPQIKEFDDPVPINEYFAISKAEGIDDIKAQLEKLEQVESIVAIGPEDHLKALQNDLRKQGYKKAK